MSRFGRRETLQEAPRIAMKTTWPVDLSPIPMKFTKIGKKIDTRAPHDPVDLATFSNRFSSELTEIGGHTPKYHALFF